MAKVYSAPEQIKVPGINFGDFKKYEEDCKKYLEELRNFLLKRKVGKNIGEIIKFPAADGYAQYMVASMRPLEIVHIPLWDGWDFHYAHLLTAKEVQKKIDQEKTILEMFSKKNS